MTEAPERIFQADNYGPVGGLSFGVHGPLRVARMRSQDRGLCCDQTCDRQRK